MSRPHKLRSYSTLDIFASARVLIALSTQFCPALQSQSCLSDLALSAQTGEIFVASVCTIV